ncbi:hypothetical protein ID866_8755, partial [Astraeus odoratus]
VPNEGVFQNRDSTASTTLRSVLSEVYNLDKLSGSKVSPSAIVGVLRKAVLRRVSSLRPTESTREFVKGGRPDLAEKESHEVDIISAFLPPLLSESDIDRVLKAAIVECPQDNANPRKMLGVVLKSFYSKVDKATVDNDLVKRKAEMLLNISSSGQPVL